MDKSDKNLVAYCSLYCPKCYKTTVSEAAAKLKKELENPHICGSKPLVSELFLSSLNDLIGLCCIKTCKDGGGNPECVIRKCCVQKKLNGCWDCGKFEVCGKLKQQYVHNVRRIKEIGIAGYLKERSK